MTLLKGNCLETLKTLPDNSIDSIVTDPPYGLEFMGKEWDAPWKNTGTVLNDPSVVGGFQDGAGGNAFSRSRIRYGFGNEASLGFQYWFTDIAIECYRVLKPGGHLLAFGGSRTYHRLASAVEDAGFEIRDQIMWLYGSGFPKSLDVSKAIDKASGFQGEVIGQGSSWNRPESVEGDTARMNASPGVYDIKELSPKAQQWQGWGTALKPAHEPIVVARKPLIGTVANNVLTYGTGTLNIDGSRVGTTEKLSIGSNNRQNALVNFGMKDNKETQEQNLQGRWPANVIHDGSDEVLAYFGEPQRFFYCAKASKSERNAGLEGLPERRESDRERDDGVGGDNPRNRTNEAKQNFHPTVKPLALMRYLVKLVTPPNGIVLDPFLGSGTTAVAATLEGFEWIGCEMTEDYWPIIEARVAWAQKEKEGKLL